MKINSKIYVNKKEQKNYTKIIKITELLKETFTLQEIMALTRSKSSTKTPSTLEDKLRFMLEETSDSESDYMPSEEECEQVTTDQESESEEDSDIELTDGSDSDCEITKVVTKDEKAEKIDLVEEDDEDIQGWYKVWSELDKWENMAADALGFTEESWFSESRYMNDFIREWEDITEEEKGYLLVLGMHRDNWNLYLDILDEDDDYEEYRQDPNDNEYYTYDEFVEWYGTDHIWKRMDPKMVMYRRALKDTYAFANTLSHTLRKEYIEKMMNTF